MSRKHGVTVVKVWKAWRYCGNVQKAMLKPSTSDDVCVCFQLLYKLEQTGLQTEGILRVPGSASRVKVNPDEHGLVRRLRCWLVLTHVAQ